MNVQQQASDPSWSEGELYRLLAENLDDHAIFVIDRQRRVLTWTLGAERLLGYSSAEILGRSGDCLFTVDDVRSGAPQRELDAALCAGHDEADRWHVRKDGSKIWTSGITKPLWDKDGCFRGLAKIMRDRTKWRLAEDALRETSERFRGIVTQSIAGVAEVDLNGNFVFVNERYCDIVGRTADELLRTKMQNITHPDDLPENASRFQQTIKNGLPFVIEKRYVRPDGSEIWVNNSVSGLRDANGKVKSVVAMCVDVTERRHAEAAQRESQGRLKTLIDNVPNGAVYRAVHSQPDGPMTFSYLSAGIKQIIGVSAEEGTADAGLVYGLIHADDRERMQREEELALQSHTQFDCEFRMWHRSGELRWVHCRSAPNRLLTGGTVWEGVILDVTDRKRVEHALLESEEQFRTAFELAAVGSVQLDALTGRVHRVNRKLCELLGYSHEELCQMTVQDLTHPEDRDSDWQRLSPLLRGEIDTYTNDKRLVRKDGQSVWVSVTSSLVRSPDGVPLRTIGIVQDLTERHSAEEALRRSEQRFRLLHDSNIIGVAIANIDGSLEDANDEFLRITGYSREDLTNGQVDWSPMTPAAYVGLDESAMRQARQFGVFRPFEKEYVRKDGSRVSVYLGAAPVGSAKDQFITFIADLTPVKKAERTTHFIAEASSILAQLTDYESTLKKVAGFAVPTFADWCAVDLIGENGDLHRVAVTHTDPEKVQLAHDLMERYPPRSDDPHGIPRVIRTGRPELVSDISDSILESLAYDTEHLRIARALGLKSYICVPLQTRGQVLGALSFVTAESGRRYEHHDLLVAEDLSRRAATAIDNAMLYAEVKNADRRKDEFLAMLAHELRNPLAPIRTGLDVLALSGTDRQVVEPMLQQIEHLVRLVDDLLDVSRIMRGRVELRRQQVQLASLIERSIATVQPLIDAHGHALTVRQADEPVWLDADPVRLTQAIANLLTNAAKYTPSGGSIMLATELRGGNVLISVKDSGIGMESDLLPRIFDLFTQATRSIDRSQGGLGIGLTVVKNLIEMHGGTVQGHSAGPGQGSEFTIVLPVAMPDQSNHSGGGLKTIGRRLRILIVDDNVAAAHMLEMLLKRLGNHETMVVYEGSHVLEAATHHRPDLILLDIGLPGMSGYEVAHSLRQYPEFHHVLLVAVTGYGTEQDRKKSLEVGFDDHAVKPLTIEAIEKMLATVQLRLEQ